MMKAPPQQADPQPEAPASCPFCHSPNVMTASEKADESAYWRCKACGDMWNVGRLETSTNRFNHGYRWK